MHAGLIAHLPGQARQQRVELSLEGRLAFLRNVVRVEIDDIYIHRQSRGHDAVQMIPDPVAHESCGNAPVRQVEPSHGTKLFHCDGVFCDDAGDEGHGPV